MGTQKHLNCAYDQLFKHNETLKLYDRTIDDLERALKTEKAYCEIVKEQITELRALLAEELHHKNQFKGLDSLQKKQIQSLGQKHIRNTS